MPTTKKKKTESKELVPSSTVLQEMGYAATLAARLDELTKTAPFEPTSTLGEAMFALKRVGRALANLEQAVKDTLIYRAHAPAPTKKALVIFEQWQDVDKHRQLDFGELGSVTVQTRESMTEKPEAIDWLAKNNPAVYISSVKEETTITNPEEFRRAFDELEKLARRTDVAVGPKLRDVVKRMQQLLMVERRLNQAALERAIASGDFPSKDLKHLYEIKTTYAVVVKQSGTNDATHGHHTR